MKQIKNPKEMKNTLNLSNKQIAEFFQFSSTNSFESSTAKKRYEKALFKFYEFLKTKK